MKLQRIFLEQLAGVLRFLDSRERDQANRRRDNAGEATAQQFWASGDARQRRDATRFLGLEFGKLRFVFIYTLGLLFRVKEFGHLEIGISHTRVGSCLVMSGSAPQPPQVAATTCRPPATHISPLPLFVVVLATGATVLDAVKVTTPPSIHPQHGAIVVQPAPSFVDSLYLFFATYTARVTHL
ncbi:hypothetical protein PIB30_069585 [Stylosanthes scabra]|uniref:Uncharacterized protein n=1 Tax=Stylosanthes scabra TaxID=79078 RepID=A0ABU6URW4_9FABA|nr:hypothetical protein [Stylosanthes scabra]